MIRRIASGLALVACTAIAACGSSDSSSTPAAAKKAVSAEIPASGCGSVATEQPKQVDNALTDLGPSYADHYAGHTGTVSPSEWSDFKPDHPPPYKVGLSFSQLTADSQVKVYEGLKKSLSADPDIDLTAYTLGSNINVPQQIEHFQSLLREKPDILIVQPLADAFDPLVAQAAKEGIPTISLLTALGSPHAVNVVTNNFQMAARAASVGARQIDGKGNALMVHGIASTSTDQGRFAGYEAALEGCPNIKVVGDIGGAFQPSLAKSETLKFLATHPEKIDIVLQAGGMAPGIISAFEQTGRPVPVIPDLSAMKGSLAYWDDNKDEYNGYGAGYSAPDFVAAATTIVQRMLAGDGIKVSEIASPYVTITEKELGDWTESDWTLKTPGVADGPGDKFMPKAFVNGLFERGSGS